MSDLTAEHVRNLLDYDPETGIFTWRVSTNSNGAKAGQRAGCRKPHGYRYVGVSGAEYSEHRLVWLYVYGRWPTEQVDHRNGVRDDNRIANLRECTCAENRQNVGMKGDNTSGHQGVRWDADRERWFAYITVGGRMRNLGRFGELEEAIAARAKAKRELHLFQPTARKD